MHLGPIISVLFVVKPWHFFAAVASALVARTMSRTRSRDSLDSFYPQASHHPTPQCKGHPAIGDWTNPHFAHLRSRRRCVSITPHFSTYTPRPHEYSSFALRNSLCSSFRRRSVYMLLHQVPILLLSLLDQILVKNNVTDLGNS